MRPSHRPERASSKTGATSDASLVRATYVGGADSPALRSERLIPWILIPVLLAVLAAQCLLSMRVKSVTYDEPFYISAGYVYLTRGRFELNREHPPLMKYFIGIPLLLQDCRPPEELADWTQAPKRRMAFGRQFLFENRPDPDTLLFWARIPTVVVSLILAVFVWKWARRLYGTAAAGIALLLYCFSPNILAHSRLATLDLGNTATIFVAGYLLWRLYVNPGGRRVVWAGIALAAAFLIKYTAVVFVALVPVFLVGAVVHHRALHHEPKPTKRQHKRPRFRRPGVTGGSAPRVGRLFLLTACVAGLVALVITFAYGFQRFGLEQYVSGFNLGVLSREQLTKSGYQSFLWGHYSAAGFREYHFAAFLIKTPIPMLLLAGASVARLMVRKYRRWFDEMFLVAPILAILLITVPIQKNFGLRNILPVYPFLFVLAAGTLVSIWRWRASKIVAPILGCWYVFSAINIYPHYLPYFNELIGGPSRGIYYLDDSNIDWGQDLKQLVRYVRERQIQGLRLLFFGDYWLEPAARYYGLPYVRMNVFREIEHPQRGWYAISAHLLQRPQLSRKSDIRFDWLERFEPEAVIGHSIYVYHFD